MIEAIQSSTPGIRLFRARHALALDPGGALPTRLRVWEGASLELPEGETHYAFALRGPAELVGWAGRFILAEGMYAAVPGSASLGGAGTGIVVSRVGHAGVFCLGGPIEQKGRLRYIDGCTDSLLLPPTRLGDPCLNHLHIPPHTRQTRHTHPSVRVGIIARGSGRCVTPDGEHPLAPGALFVIAPDALHCFHTDDSALDVVVYHPDSDTGPTDEDHPMLNRTIIGKGAPS